MEASTAPEAEPTIEEDVFYQVKTIRFLGRKAPIILHEANGPCPLVAICNVLSLKNRLDLSPDVVRVSQKKLLSLVAEHWFDSNDIEDIGRVFDANHRQNIADALDLLHRHPACIDLDINFRRIDDFAFTRELAIFDSLNISLYHGWIVDPQDHETAEAIGSKSFNALMEELVALDAVNFENGDIEEEAELLRVQKLAEDSYHLPKPNTEPNMQGSVKSMSKGELIKKFMRNSSSQLTVYGVARLKEKVKEGQVCVLFRNNRLNTMFKRKGKLYILVADEGFMDQPDLVWENLNEVDGDIQYKYMTGKFEELKMDDHSTPNSTEDSLGSTDNAAHEGPIIDVDSEVALASQIDEYYGDELPQWLFED